MAVGWYRAIGDYHITNKISASKRENDYVVGDSLQPKSHFFEAEGHTFSARNELDSHSVVRKSAMWLILKFRILLGGELIYPKLPKTKKSQCYQTFLGAVLCIKAGENFEFGER